MIRKIFFTGIISLFAMLTIVAQKNVIDEIIWVVGDEAILRSDVENYRLFMLESKTRIEGNPYCFIPEQLAVNKLFLSQAKIDSISADESSVIRQVDYYINYMIQGVGGTTEKLEEYFGKKLSQIKEERKKMVRDEMIVSQMKRKIVGDIKLRPSEVTTFYNQMSKDNLPTIPTTVEVAVIMLEPPIPVEDVDAIKAQLRSITEEINNAKPEDPAFEYLAMRYSEDPVTAPNGGQTGFRSKLELSPEYAAAAFALSDPKRVSGIVQTEYGYHIIQLIEKKGDRINTRHILLRPKVSEQSIEKATANLDTIYTAIMDEKLKFEEATYFSSDKNTRNNNGLMVNKDEESNNQGSSRFEMQELPQGMGVIIDKMQVGEISKPFRLKNAAQNDVVAIVKLVSRIDVHQANLQDDYLELKNLVEEKKKSEIINEWINSKQKTTFVRVSDGWNECEFLYPGWIKK